MPFYEYQCSACGHHHEELQKITDGVLRKCPACGRSKLKRLMSAPAFRLKGGGWYETDFKGDKDSQRNLAGDKEPATGAGPPPEKPKDGTKDAKPDAKADAKPAEKSVAPPAPTEKITRVAKPRTVAGGTLRRGRTKRRPTR